jgi:hypothetical protein
MRTRPGHSLTKVFGLAPAAGAAPAQEAKSQRFLRERGTRGLERVSRIYWAAPRSPHL